MKYHLKYTKEALKDLVMLPNHTSEKIFLTMNWNFKQENPLKLSKTLGGYFEGKFRLMVDGYRIICKSGSKNQIFVMAVLILNKRCRIFNI